MKKRTDLTGRQFGRLIVDSFYGVDEKNRSLWLCYCNCKKTKKNVVIIYDYSLIRKNTQSCGCLRREIQKRLNTKHGMTETHFYKIWSKIKHRCNNQNNNRYKHYGGRGIRYDPRWDDFLEFKRDMYFDYLRAIRIKKIKKPSIERIDNDGNYCKKNCCWILLKEQNKNTRNLKWFEGTSPKNKKFISNNQRCFCKKHNLMPQNVNSCLNKKRKKCSGWSFRYLTKEELDEKTI